MYRDVTLLPSVVNCIKITDDKSLIVYTNDSTSIYKLISNKYYATETYDANTPATETVCYTIEDAQTLPSNYDFIVPIFHTIAILSAILIFYGAYKLILYPFFRKVVFRNNT